MTPLPPPTSTHIGRHGLRVNERAVGDLRAATIDGSSAIASSRSEEDRRFNSQSRTAVRVDVPPGPGTFEGGLVVPELTITDGQEVGTDGTNGAASLGREIGRENGV